MAAKKLVPLIIYTIVFLNQQTQGAEEPSLTFACANGVITDILGVNKTDVVVLDGSQYCHFDETGCKWENKKTLSVVYVQGEINSNIAGGKNAHFYNLECKTAGDFVASVTHRVVVATAIPTDRFTKATVIPPLPTDAIHLSINNKFGTKAGEVHIGQELILSITGPEDYEVEPLNCTANIKKPGLSDYTLWENDDCSSADTSIVDGNWTEDSQHSNTISLAMYGFRFVTSNWVVVTCTAHFCPKNNTKCYEKSCLYANGGAKGRKRRNADSVDLTFDEGYIEDSMSTYFTVVDSLVDSSACRGPFVSVFMFITTMVLMLTSL